MSPGRVLTGSHYQSVSSMDCARRQEEQKEQEEQEEQEDKKESEQQGFWQAVYGDKLNLLLLLALYTLQVK